MLNTKIIDSDGSGQSAKVTDEGNLNVIVAPKPPENGALMQPVNKKFEDTTGNSDMRVVGSLTAPIDFTVNAEADYDTYIKSITVLIADASASLGQFGAISALTNGVQFIWETKDQGELIIVPELKTNFSFVELAGGNPAFGDGVSAFRASNVVGSSDAYFQRIDIGQIFGVQWGLKLRKNTGDRLIFRVRDDTTPVDAFEIIAYGAKI